MMPLLTQTDLATMDYSYRGRPFVAVVTKTTTDTATMDYSYRGRPFVVNPAPGATGNFLVFFR